MRWTERYEVLAEFWYKIMKERERWEHRMKIGG
jgi:hypothetical protein